MRSLAGVLLIIFGLVWIQTGCAPDAPHDNPLDPLSPNYTNTGNLTGKVLTLTTPYAGIAGALVKIEGTDLSQYTSSTGDFSFADAPAGNITLIVSKSLYVSDTLHITIPVEGSYSATVHLDALPIITNAKVVTAKIDQWWPGAIYYATVTANVTDPDGVGDIVDSTVRVSIDTISFRMSYSGGTGTYGVTIIDTLLPPWKAAPTKHNHEAAIEWLVGRQLVVSTTDRENATSFSQPFYVTRIIDPGTSEPSPTSPVNSDTAASSPKFGWNPPQVAYDYTYFLQIYVINAGVPTQVGNTISISSSNLGSYTYSGNLNPGSYIWTIGIIDQYGNSCRSAEAAFVVP